MRRLFFSVRSIWSQTVGLLACCGEKSPCRVARSGLLPIAITDLCLKFGIWHCWDRHSSQLSKLDSIYSGHPEFVVSREKPTLSRTYQSDFRRQVFPILRLRLARLDEHLTVFSGRKVPDSSHSLFYTPGITLQSEQDKTLRAVRPLLVSALFSLSILLCINSHETFQ